MILSGNEAWNRNVFKCWRKVDRDGADITLSGRLFQMVGPATGKARPPTVDSLTDGIPCRLPADDWSQESGGNADQADRRHEPTVYTGREISIVYWASEQCAMHSSSGRPTLGKARTCRPSKLLSRKYSSWGIASPISTRFPGLTALHTSLLPNWFTNDWSMQQHVINWS